MSQIPSKAEATSGAGLVVGVGAGAGRVDQRMSEKYKLGTSPRPEGLTRGGSGGGGEVLRNRAGESRSPYVRAHMSNPVAWQLWSTETIELAKRENKLLFVSIGYSACHWCHVMEHESFENQEIATILNSQFIPVKIDREERPDIDRIYMNFVQATTGSGGWPLNVFVTPELEPVFGGTYWPGPNSTTPQLGLEDQLDFLGILRKLDTVWLDQEDRCRQESSQILQQLKEFASEGSFGSTANARLGEGDDGLDIDVLDDAFQKFVNTFDTINGGFGDAPKFPTPSKLNFLLRLNRFPPSVIDIVGQKECNEAERMAILTLKKMARGGIRDHIGHGFSRYSVTKDWSLPHFEKMLYDNAQLLNAYLDAWLISYDPELLNVVYDIATYLTSSPISVPRGGFCSSEDADSFYRASDSEKREGAFYVWTQRELHNVLGSREAEVVSAFYGVSDHGNISPENDMNDEFMNQNVFAIVSTPNKLASQFGMSEKEVVDIIKESKKKLQEHREKERLPPSVDDKIVTGWNGLAVGALARTSSALKTFDSASSERFLSGATKAAKFLRENLYDEKEKTLTRVWREEPGDVSGFADDYAFLIDGLIDLYESTFNEEYLQWADDLQKTQIKLFYDFLEGQSLSSPKPRPSTPPRSPTTYLPSSPGLYQNQFPRNNSISSTISSISTITASSSAATETESAITGAEDDVGAGGFFATPLNAQHTILRLKDGMDTAEPSINGVSISNLYRLGSMLADEEYAMLAKRSLLAFEGEIMQYPWLFSSFMVGIVAKEFGVRSVVFGDFFKGESKEVAGEGSIEGKVGVKARGGISTVVRVTGESGWIKERNSLLKDFKTSGKERVMICEGGKCRFEGGDEGEKS